MILYFQAFKLQECQIFLVFFTSFVLFHILHIFYKGQIYTPSLLFRIIIINFPLIQLIQRRIMKFFITSKDQTDGTKQKIPFYKYVQKQFELKQQPPQYEMLQHPNLKIYCQQCQKDITIGTIVVAYGTLQPPEQQPEEELDLARLYCVGCFSNLSTLPDRYAIRKSLKYTFTNSSWNLFDEVSLLNSLQIWGFGNWNQIKDFMDYNGSTFSAQQIQNHYQQVFLTKNGSDIKFLTQNNQPRAKKKQTLQQIQHHYYFSCLYQNNDTKIRNNVNVQKSQIQGQIQNPFKRQRQDSLDNPILPKLSFSCQEESKNNQQNDYEQHYGENGVSHNDFNRQSQQNEFHIENYRQLNSNKPQDYKQSQKINYFPLSKKIQNTVYEQDEDEQDQNQNDENQPQSLTVQLKPRPSFRNIPQRQNQGQKKNHSGKGLASSVNLQSQRNLTLAEQKLKGNNVYSYNPKRKQFQIIEYDYYAQTMLAYLQFYEGQSMQEQLVKIEVIRQYNRRLDQRKRRRQFVIQHRLLDNHFHFHNIKNVNFGAKKFEAFRRFTVTLEQYQEILTLYGEEIRIRRIIQGLKKLRSTVEKGKVKEIVGYIAKKKQKKMLLGSSQKQNFRKVYQNHKDSNAVSKKLILVGPNQSIFNDLRINVHKKGNLKLNSSLNQQSKEFNLAPSQIDYLQRKINIQKVEDFHIGNFKITQLKKKVNRFQNDQR